MIQIKLKTAKPTLVVSIIEGRGRIPDFNKSVDRLYNYLYDKGFENKVGGL